MPTLEIHKKSRFQPNEEIFAESSSVRYKDLFRAKKIFGVIGTLSLFVEKSHRSPSDLELKLWRVALLIDVFDQKTRSHLDLSDTNQT